MKKLLSAIAFIFMMAVCQATTVDTYQLKMSLKIPQVYDNFQSLGYRKYKTQKFKGIVYVQYDADQTSFEFGTLTNLTHKLSTGKQITYDVSHSDYPRWNYIGSNKTKKFKLPTTLISFEAYPNYALSDIVTDDNSLYLQLAGYGISSKTGPRQLPKRLKGYATGSLGCGCAEYGHISPTRLIGYYGPLLDHVDDVAPVLGTWQMKYLTTSVVK